MARKSNCRRRAGGALNKGCEGALGLCRRFQVAENAKKPLLAYLAKRMTSAGQTSLTWANDIEEEVETQLMKIRRRVKRLGGMLKEWTVDGCLACARMLCVLSEISPTT
jgi:hypothetical protein